MASDPLRALRRTGLLLMKMAHAESWLPVQEPKTACSAWLHPAHSHWEPLRYMWACEDIMHVFYLRYRSSLQQHTLKTAGSSS